MQKFITLSLALLLYAIGRAQSSEPNDCINAIPICSGTTYSSPTQGVQGDDCDVTSTNRGCIGGVSGTIDPYPTGSAEELFCRNEYAPTFFWFRIATSGTLEFLATSSTGYDLDFAMWGPIPATPTSTLSDYCTWMRSNPPIRCNFCSGGIGGSTGLQGSGSSGGCPTREANLAVTAGQVFILDVQQWAWPPNAVGFSLYFNGGTGSNRASSTATFDCAILPLSWQEFTLTNVPEGVELEWVTAHENGTRYFEIQRAGTDMKFQSVGTHPATGMSSDEQRYVFTDNTVSPGVWYYRIAEYDLTGAVYYSDILNTEVLEAPRARRILRVADLLGRDYSGTGPRIVYYDDGTWEKQMLLK